jgi:AraC-like DNA-binding protein
MPRLIRSAVLNNYVGVARSVGLDPYRMLARHALPASCLTDPETKISADKVGELLDDSAKRSDKVDFGLRLAEQRTLSNVGALALLAREQPTVRKALEVLASYMFLHSDALTIKVQQGDELTVVTFAIEVDRPIAIRQGVELGVGFLHRSFQQLFRERWRPQAVCFTHAAPRSSDAHRKFFGTTVRFNQDFNGLICASRDLDAPVPAADAAMAKHVKAYLDTFASRRHSEMASSVRECIYTMLPSGLCSASSIARRLGVDRKTMHRHLKQEGETYSTVLDAVRSELVTRHIANESRSLTALAELLGFSQLSAFSRWFRRSFGCSVSQWRAGQAPSRSARQLGAISPAR